MRTLLPSILALLITFLGAHAESKRVITKGGNEYTVSSKGRNIRVAAPTFSVAFSIPEGWQTVPCPATYDRCVVAAQSSHADLSLVFSIQQRWINAAESPFRGHFRHYVLTEHPFLLSDGRRIRPVSDYPDHLERDLLLPISEGEHGCSFAFSAPSPAALRTSRSTIQLILDSYVCLVPKRI